MTRIKRGNRQVNHNKARSVFSLLSEGDGKGLTSGTERNSATALLLLFSYITIPSIPILASRHVFSICIKKDVSCP